MKRSKVSSDGITLGLLTGGRGRRLGGAKESLVDADGRSLLRHQLRRTRGLFAETLLLVREDQPFGDLPTGVRQTPDPSRYRGDGPLAGLLGGLTACATPWLALLPIDNPTFPASAFESALASVGVPCASTIVGFVDGDLREQWLPGLYHRSLASAVEAALLAGTLSLGDFVRTHQAKFLPWRHNSVDAGTAFANLNTLEEAQAAGFYRDDLPEGSNGTSRPREG